MKYRFLGKDIEASYIISWTTLVIGLAMNMLVYLYLPECNECKLTYNNSIISGNCTYIKNMYAEKRRIERGEVAWIEYDIKDEVPKLNQVSSDIADCPPCPTAAEECLPDIKVIQVNFTTVDMGYLAPAIDNETKSILLNLKPGPNGNPAISHGFFECKKKILDVLKLTGATYDEGPAPPQYYYDTLKPQNKTIQFRDWGDYFYIDNNLFNITDVGNNMTRIVRR
jgi:hypothetical protein